MRAVAVREDIRDLIINAAERLLARYGFQKMTMDDLAREVGIAKATIYLHFAGKEEIALARVDRVIAELLGRLSEIARSDKPPAERLTEMLTLRVLFRLDRIRRYAQSIDEQLAAIRPALRARRREHFREEARIFVRVLEDGRRRKEFFFEDTEDTAHTLLTATSGLLPSNLDAEELKDREGVGKRISRISELLARGLTVKH